MASLTLQSGKKISFPDGLQPEQVKKIVAAASASDAPPAANPDVAVPWYTPITSAPGNAWDAAAGLVSAVRHPIDTAQNLANLGNGAIANIPGVTAANDWAVAHGLAPAYDKTKEANDQALAGLVASHIKGSFDSPTHAWNTIATHPVDTLLTVAPVVGQVGKLADAANLAKTADALGTASEFTNPVNLVAKPVSVAKNWVRPPNALQTAINGMGDPSAELDAVKQAAKTKWDAIENRNVQIPPSDYNTFVSDLLKSTDKIGNEAAPVASSFRSKLAGLNPQGTPGGMVPGQLPGGAHASIYQAPVAPTSTVPFNDINEIFRNVKKAAVDPKLDGTEQALAGKIASKTGALIDSVPGLQADLADANELSRRKILAEKLAKMKDKAEWYTSGNESGLKNQVSSMGKSEGHTMTPEEKAAYQNIVRKEGLNSMISTAGGRLGQLILHGVGAGVGAAIPGVGPILGMAAAGGTHLAARALSEARTLNAVNDALKTVLLGKPGQMAARIPLKRIPFNDKEWVKALLAGRAVSAYGATQ